MASQSRQKTFHYKRAQFVGVAEGSLSKLFLAAQKKEKRPMKRAQRLGTDGENCRLINQCYAKGGDLVVGCMLDFTVGNFQPIVTLDEEGFELAISQLEPGAKEQILEGMLFFGVEENHVVILQSAKLKAREFENYVNWWLVQNTGVLSSDGMVSLDNEPSREAKEKLSGVRSVVLRAPVILDNDHIAHSSETGLAIPEQRSLTGLIKERILDMLRMDGMFAEHADASAAMTTEEIDLSIEIRRRGRRVDGPTLLDELAHALRNEESDVFELETAEGTVRGGELRLNKVRSVKTLNGVPELQDVAEKMRECMALFKEESRFDEE